MNINNDRKMNYVPPRVAVTRMVLETVIAASPVPKVNLQDWELSDENVPGNTSDVTLYF